MNLRAFDIATGEMIQWNSATTVPGGGAGRTLPAAGTGVHDKEGREIFCGDIVEHDGSLYLAKLKRGGFWLESLDGDGSSSGRWLHEIVDGECRDQGGIGVAGDTRRNAGWLAGVLRSRAEEGMGREISVALDEERTLTRKAGEGGTATPRQ